LLKELESFDVPLGRIHGYNKTYKRDDREMALRLLNPESAPHGPAFVVGTPQTGRTAFNLTAAHNVIYSSGDFSLYTRMQSEDRVHRPGQIADVNYYDLVATGPAGQKTVDHLIQNTIRGKFDVANWTTSAWVRALREE